MISDAACDGPATDIAADGSGVQLPSAFGPINQGITLQTASRQEQWLCLGIILALLSSSVAAYVGGGRVMPAVPAFIPAFSTATGLSDALTAVLLLSLYPGERSRVLLFAAAAYLLNALLIVPYTLTFPGVIDASGYVGNEQSAVWLWVTWHFGFALLVLIGMYRSSQTTGADGRIEDRPIVVAACLVFSAAATLLVTAGRSALPTLLHHGVFSSLFTTLTFIAALTNLAACAAVLAVKRPPPVLHVWLAVALAASALDTALNGVAPARYSIPWYVGKAQTFASASIVLVALLGAWSALQRRAIALADGLSRTIADRRILEQQLLREREVGILRQRAADAENLFDVVVEKVPSAIVLVTNEGLIILLNAEAESLLGYARDELLGQSIAALIRDRGRRDPWPTLAGRLQPAASGTQLREQPDLVCVRKDQREVPVEIRLNPFKSGSGSFVLAAITDITERSAAEALRILQADTKRQSAELEAERERKMSTAFQRAVLPATLPEVVGCSFEAVYEPGPAGDHVGGDWYDAVHLVDGRVFLAIGDVAGTGLDAAVVVGVARQVMRGIAQLHANPSVILDAADRALCLEYPGIYVSAWVGLIDLVTQTLTYASAGHPAPLIVTEDGRVRELCDPTTMLIGLREGHRGQPNTAKLAPRNTLVLYTDGVIEAGRDVIGGMSTLHAALARLHDTTAGISAGSIARELLPDDPFDDCAVLVVRTDCGIAEQHILRWTFAVASPAQAAAVRREVITSLSDHHFTSEDCANAELVLGELIGNVVRHGGSTRSVEVALDHSGPHAVLHVMDRGSGFYHVGRLPRDPYAESGRGLYLIGALSVDFTVSERPDGGSHARVVLCGGSSLDIAAAKPLRMTAMA